MTWRLGVPTASWWQPCVLIAMVLGAGLYFSAEVHRQARRCRVDALRYHTGRAHLSLSLEGAELEMACVARHAHDCLEACKDEGGCTVDGGACVPTLNRHCRESRACRQWGDCHLRDGRCVRPRGLVLSLPADEPPAPAPPSPGPWPMADPEVDPTFCAAERSMCTTSPAFCIVRTHPFPLWDDTTGCYGADPEA